MNDILTGEQQVILSRILQSADDDNEYMMDGGSQYQDLDTEKLFDERYQLLQILQGLLTSTKLIKPYTEEELRNKFEAVQRADGIADSTLACFHGVYANKTVNSYWAGWKEFAREHNLLIFDKATPTDSHANPLQG